MVFLNGSVFPFFGYTVANVLGVLNNFAVVDNPNFGYTKESILKEIDKYLIWFIIVSLFSFYDHFLQLGIFNYIGEKFTYTLKLNILENYYIKILNIFDKKENKPGNLSAILSKECKIINVLIGNFLVYIIMGLFSFLLEFLFRFLLAGEWL